MTISWIQAVILGIFACLASMPGMGGSAIGNYTLGRPLVAGLVCGIILGNVPAGIMVGAAMQVVYIALVTPGGTVSADVLAVGQREAQIQGIAVGEVIAGQALTGIGIAAHRVHPAGALSIVELAQTVVIRLARQGQAVLQDLAPQVLRDGGIVHHAAPADAPQIEAHVHGAGVFVLVAPLLQRLDNGIGGRGILANFVGIRLLHHIQSHGGGVDDDIGRADDVAGIHEAVEDAIGHEGGVALPVPGPDGNGVLHRIAHDGIREVELILVHRARRWGP